MALLKVCRRPKLRGVKRYVMVSALGRKIVIAGVIPFDRTMLQNFMRMSGYDTELI